MKLDRSKTVDQEFQELRALGYTGEINDMLAAYLADQGLTGSVSDKLGHWTGAEQTTRDFVMQLTVPPGDGNFVVQARDLGVYNGTIVWGDGTQSTITAFNDADLTHTYAEGQYEFRILADSAMPGVFFQNTTGKDWITSIDNMGHIGLTELGNFADNLDGLGSLTFGDTDLSVVGSMLRFCFAGATDKNIVCKNTAFPNLTNMRDAYLNSSVTTADYTGSTFPVLSNVRSAFQGAKFGGGNPPAVLAPLFATTTAINAQNFCAGLQNVIDVGDLDCPDWDITPITVGTGMFGASTLTTALYDATLISWEGQAPPNAISVDFGSSTYTSGGAAEAARTSLINTYGWTITDGGSVPVLPFNMPILSPDPRVAGSTVNDWTNYSGTIVNSGNSYYHNAPNETGPNPRSGQDVALPSEFHAQADLGQLRHEFGDEYTRTAPDDIHLYAEYYDGGGQCLGADLVLSAQDTSYTPRSRTDGFVRPGTRTIRYGWLATQYGGQTANGDARAVYGIVRSDTTYLDADVLYSEGAADENAASWTGGRQIFGAREWQNCTGRNFHTANNVASETRFTEVDIPAAWAARVSSGNASVRLDYYIHASAGQDTVQSQLSFYDASDALISTASSGVGSPLQAILDEDLVAQVPTNTAKIRIGFVFTRVNTLEGNDGAVELPSLTIYETA